MNYLAHAFLSPDDPYIRMGNLWGDLLRPKDYPGLHPGLMQGVIIHKAIDAYTDQHGAVDQIVTILRPYQGKYTPVVADVLMDYVLCKYWADYHRDSIEDFCKMQYRVVDELLHHMPTHLHLRISRMRTRHWLESCKDRDHLRGALLMLSQRASFDNHIPGALAAYDRHTSEIDLLFKKFFAELRELPILRSES
jgi:acyl carrier protein phosphodiesterase